jgi:hypothetical protein
MLIYAASVHNLAAEQLEEVIRLHDQALGTGEIPGRMQALIKNVVENQRSVLDYTAQAIANRYGCQGKTYWMAAKSPQLFGKVFDKNLPGVRMSEPKIAQAFERHQPYQPDHAWVLQLFELTRENKHHRLTRRSAETNCDRR